MHDNGTFQLFGERDGLVPGLVLAFLEDKSGAVWVATSGGLSRYQNGRFTSLTKANAPLVDLVPVLVEDDEGYIWVGVNTGVGVIRFHPREVDRMASNPGHHIEYALYDGTDGLQQAPLTWQSGVGAVRARDGKLWLTSGPGIAVIDPQPAAAQPPAVRAARRNGCRRRAGAGAGIGPDPACRHLHAAHRVRHGEPVVGVEAALPLSARRPRRRLGVRGPAP